MSEKGIVHPDTTKIRCAYLYAALGNYSEVARQTKIKRTSIMNWAKDSDVWHEAVDKARQEISDELLAINLENARLAGDELSDRIKNGDHKLVMSRDSDGKYHHIARVPMNGKDLAVVGGINLEKGLLLQSKPTSISATSNSIEQYTKFFTDIANKVKAEQAKQTNSIPGECEEIE